MIKEKVVERRKSPRVKDNFSVEIAQEKSSLIADTINISASGIYCQSDSPMPLFREIVIKIKLPDKKDIIECSGVVVRCEKVSGKERYNLAIFFEDISSKDKENLSGYLERKLN